MSLRISASTAQIADAAFAYSNAVEKGDKKVVGVNTLTGGVGDELKISPRYTSTSALTSWKLDADLHARRRLAVVNHHHRAAPVPQGGQDGRRLRRVMLEHHPHGLHIIAGKAPVSFRIQIPQVELIL